MKFSRSVEFEPRKRWFHFNDVADSLWNNSFAVPMPTYLYAIIVTHMWENDLFGGGLHSPSAAYLVMS